METQKQWDILEQASRGYPSWHRKRQALNQYAVQVSQQAEVMQYLKQHNPELTQKVQRLAKTYERNLALDRGVSR